MTLERLEQLEAELAALPGEEVLQRPLDANRTTRAVLESRIETIRFASHALANVAPQIAAVTTQLAEVTEWRSVLCDRLLAEPPRPRTDVARGRVQALTLSIQAIDRGLGVMSGSGWEQETLPLGELMRAAGYEEGPKVANQVRGQLPWPGSIPELERRLRDLQQQRDDAQRRLDDALLDDAERERLAAERMARFNATPQRKTRGDGSQYDRYPDGRVVEVLA